MCTSCEDLLLRNVKLHFIVSGEIIIPSQFEANTTVRHVRNFLVLRSDHFVFTIFTSGYVNLTGVRDFEDIPNGLRVFNDIFKLAVLLNDVVVDNTTFTSTLRSRSENNSRHTNLFKVLKRVNELRDAENKLVNLRITLQPHHFPGAVLRRDGKPTVIIFASRKIVIVGARTREDAVDSQRFICALTNPDPNWSSFYPCK